MKNLLVALIFLFPISISFGQIMVVSKDTLKFQDNPYFSEKLDSLLVYNTADSTLKIDSIFTKLFLPYQLSFKYHGIIKQTDRIQGNKSSISPMIIPPNDSAKFIFEYSPFILTKISQTNKIINDSILIHNNSKNIPILIITSFAEIIVDVKNVRNIPVGYSLSQNFPNPFNPTTAISYQLPSFSHVMIKVYDVLGREVTALVNENKPAGNYSVKFDGNKLVSGIYFYRMESGSFSQTKKLLLLK
jgi:Secretion system C-terminal sorting domain